MFRQGVPQCNGRRKSAEIDGGSRSQKAGKVTRRLRLGRRAEKRASESNTLAPTRLRSFHAGRTRGQDRRGRCAAPRLNDASLSWKASTSTRPRSEFARDSAAPASKVPSPPRSPRRRMAAPSAWDSRRWTGARTRVAAGSPRSPMFTPAGVGGGARLHRRPRLLSAIGAVERACASHRITPNRRRSALDVLACSLHRGAHQPRLPRPTSLRSTARSAASCGLVCRAECTEWNVPPHGCAALDTTSCAFARRIAYVRCVAGRERIHSASGMR